VKSLHKIIFIYFHLGGWRWISGGYIYYVRGDKANHNIGESMNAIISIGFNVTQNGPHGRYQAPMDAETQWLFKNEVIEAVSKHLRGQVVQKGFVSGYWEGQTEPSWTITMAMDEDAQQDIPSLKSSLSSIAFLFHQDCIALTLAEPTFISA
jgi:hypothetical protein